MTKLSETGKGMGKEMNKDKDYTLDIILLILI
jgi:hypothetical protein